MKKNYEKCVKKDQKIGEIMGIKVNSTSKEQVLTRVESLMSHSSKFYIVTPNPELVLASIYNSDLKNALNSATFSIPDGIGLKIADPFLQIIKGRELFLDLIKLAAKNNWKVFLLGGLDNEAERATKNLVQSHSKLVIKYNAGPMLDDAARPLSSRDTEIEKEVRKEINEFCPNLLFVAYGNPKQEIWVHDNISKLNIGGAMCIGGTLRYVAGFSPFPPKWMASMGLEWLWRLVTEPIRLKRVVNAVVVFPIKYLLSRIN